MPSLRRPPRTVAALAVVAATALGAPAVAVASHLPYHDPSLPVATRVADLLARMGLDEKLGQMTQAERSAVSNADITNFRLGSLLSGGGPPPSPPIPRPRAPRRARARAVSADRA